MTDYSKLVKALRYCSTTKGMVYCNVNCKYGLEERSGGCKDILMTDAAAAIEELQAQLPKRGEIVRCKECIHFTQGGWCDREFDWFPVDGNDFCSMAEKMEVRE